MPQTEFMRASGYIWIQAEGRGLIFGVGLYDSSAYVFAEGLMGKPGVPIRLAHQAALMAISAFVSYAALAGKWPVAHPESRGVAKVLERKGFNRRPCITMSRMPFVQMALADKAPRPKKLKKRGRTGPRRKSA